MVWPRVGFARWRASQASGGNRFDDELAAGLRRRGADVREYAVPGSWPTPEHRDRLQLRGILKAEEDWVIGNILGSAAPEAVRGATEAGCRVTLLMHYFPSDDVSLPPSHRHQLAAGEAEAVECATTIVVTSAWAADQVATRYGRRDAIIAVPGADPAEPAAGSLHAGRPPHLLWLGRLTRGKDPLTFVDALSRLRHLPWSAQLVGPDGLDTRLESHVRERIAGAGLVDRIGVPGSLHGAALEGTWAHTDLLVHTSRAETYGMVVAEALARGIPSIVASGTGATEAQRVGARFAPGDVAGLASTLEAWLVDPQLREDWRTEAARLRLKNSTWEHTVDAVWSALAP